MKLLQELAVYFAKNKLLMLMTFHTLLSYYLILFYNLLLELKCITWKLYNPESHEMEQ